MVGSAAVHLAVLVVPWRGSVESEGSDRRASDEPWSGVEVVHLRVPDEPPALVGSESSDPTPMEEDPADRSNSPDVPIASGPAPRLGAASAASRLRSSGPDPRLVDVSAGELPNRSVAQGRVSGIIAATLARPPEVAGRDSMKLTTWGDDGGLRLAPGVLTIGGVALPFCGGPDAARCGFGVRPWDLERADLEADLIRELEEQGRWESIQERARAVRRHVDARRDSASGGGGGA